MKQRLLNILFWSIISAAFIGPGTITTAASAGAGFGYSLLWALTFSIVACVVLQEASARLTAVTGLNLGASIREYFGGRPAGRAAAGIIAGTIILGCAAYEAGNLLGAVAGASLLLDVPVVWLTLSTGVVAGVFLWFGSIRLIAQLLGVVVGLMGVCFLTTAVLMGPSLGPLLSGALVPRLPAGSELLVLALIGTTVVPYNLFLGSGLAHGQSLKEMRLSLGIAIILGGIISGGVLIVGTAITGTFTFEALAEALALQVGGWAAGFLGLGLYAAGFTSVMTASLAAAITARSLSRRGRESAAWQDDGRFYRSVWLGVLAVGIGFGVAQVQPVPAIILAQALNGIILPIVAVFLLLMVNNTRALGPAAINSVGYNVLMGIVAFVTLVIGLTSLGKALGRALDIAMLDEQMILLSATALAVLLASPVVRQLRLLRRSGRVSAP